MFLTTVTTATEPTSDVWEPSLEMVAALAGFERLVAAIKGADVVGRTTSLSDDVIIDLVDRDVPRAA